MLVKFDFLSKNVYIYVQMYIALMIQKLQKCILTLFTALSTWHASADDKSNM